MVNGRGPGAAVVTGAGRGVGRAIALALAEEGRPVALQSRTQAQLYDTREAIEAVGGRARVVPGDVTQRAAAEDLVERCVAELGPLRLAVACAGQAHSAPLLDTSADRLRQLLEANAVSVLHLIQVAARQMKQQGEGGAIVVVASTAAVKGMRYTSAYSASKHAVLGLVKSAALELASHAITVNAICPGWVDTPMFDATLRNIREKTGRSLEEAKSEITGLIPMRRVLSPEEVASLVAYLARPEARHWTGQALVLDGGETIR